MRNTSFKLPVLFAMLVFSAFSFAGDCCDVSSAACDPANCPPGCCTVQECQMICAESAGWVKSQWQDISYDQKGHVAKVMSKRQAMSIARQYVEMFNFKADIELTDTKNDVFRFAMRRDGLDFVTMLEVNRRNGWVRQYDEC